MTQFIARENIRRFKAQLQAEPEGARKATINRLLEGEEHRLRDLLAGRE